MNAITAQYKELAIGKAITLAVDAEAKGVERHKELRDWAFGIEREMRRVNRQALASAIWEGSQNAAAAGGLLKQAWTQMEARANAANKAVARVAAVADWPDFAPDSRPVVLWQGVGKTQVAASNIVELITQLKTEPELLNQLKVQGQGIAAAGRYSAVLEDVRTNFQWLLNEYEGNLKFLGKYQKPEHAVTLMCGATVNVYAWKNSEAVRSGKGSPSNIMRGLVDMAKYAAEQSVVHAHFAKIEANGFWVAEGVMPKPQDPRAETSPYYGADEVHIRTPFFGTTSLGRTPDHEEVLLEIADQRKSFAAVGEELEALARRIDAVEPQLYYVNGDQVAIDEVFAYSQQRLDERDAAHEARWEATKKQRIIARAKNLLAQAEGLNAVEKAKYLKAGCLAVEGMTEALKELRAQAKAKAGAV